MEFNEKEIRAKYPPHEVETQVEFDKVMEQINFGQRQLVQPFAEKELELLNQRTLLKQQMTAIRIQIDAIDMQKRTVVAQHKEINRVFHEIKHEFIMLNPKEKFINPEKE